MSEPGYARTAYLEALNDAFTYSTLGPVQLIIGGVVFDVKSIEVVNTAAQIIDQSDVVVSAKLQDGRELTFLASRVDGFVVGNAWE